MKNVLTSIVGSIVKEIEKHHEYIQIKFKNGVVVNIFNSFEVVGHAKQSAISKICGSKLIKIINTEERVEFIFSKKIVVRISLRDEDYRGPEAIVCVGLNGEYVVWQ